MIEFLEDVHCYLVDGVFTPSVTQIVRTVAGEDYSKVPPAVLRRKASYGDKIHEWIEHYSMTGEELQQTDEMKLSTDQWKIIKDKFGITIQCCEEIVSFENHYAGKFDMFGYDSDGLKTLIDIKTTAKYDEEYLQWQLGMYKKAIKYTFGWDVDRCCCLWLPKKKMAILKDVLPKSDEEITEVVNKYEKCHAGN